MKITTRIFGEVDIDDGRIITFPKGIIGFPEMQKFAMMYDQEQGLGAIHWLQSLDEPAFAMPVMDPLYVKDDYNPQVEDDVLEDVKPINPETTLVLVTVTVPHELEKMTVNLKGPIVINTEKRTAAQIILDEDEYPVKFPIYEILKAAKDAKEAEK
ncbi:MAG: flagellar assembly protein FliW [Lachnospiraceae bacterium]|nr:flagellar assembly protein FliW [Lachnospiraceae bacterium]